AGLAFKALSSPARATALRGGEVPSLGGATMSKRWTRTPAPAKWAAIALPITPAPITPATRTATAMVAPVSIMLSEALLRPLRHNAQRARGQAHRVRN